MPEPDPQNESPFVRTSRSIDFETDACVADPAIDTAAKRAASMTAGVRRLRSAAQRREKHRARRAAMRLEGLGWLGVRTERFEETARFFREIMGLRETRREHDVAGFAFPDGTEVEVWRPEDEFHSFFGPGPVVGFRVDDVWEVRAEMEAQGVEFLTPVQRSEKAAWSHFRGPDGNVYEIIARR
jgi:catechol 2,3-dioxygenase-like lactoylglutathione lyase family enzyme